MTTLVVPATGERVDEPGAITEFLAARGVAFERWEASAPFAPDASQEEVLAAYRHRLDPFMQARGFAAADVVVLYPDHPQREAIRAKFLSEHTHSEDEVRFFVEGSGLFWFNTGGEVFGLLCEAGDFLAVPAGVTHWFDCGERPHVKAIRVFTNQEGWVPNYTGSGIEARYPAPAGLVVGAP